MTTTKKNTSTTEEEENKTQEKAKARPTHARAAGKGKRADQATVAVLATLRIHTTVSRKKMIHPSHAAHPRLLMHTIISHENGGKVEHTGNRNGGAQQRVSEALRI